MFETELILERVGFPPFSARNCQQTLTPLSTGDFRRTVNGQLVYTGHSGHHKYYSTIQCQDQTIPSFDHIWRGSIISVGCIQRLSQDAKVNQKIFLERDPVPHSVYVIDENREEFEIESVVNREVTLKEKVEEGQKRYIFYCPSLQMRLINFKLLTDEWGKTNGWQLELEEI